MRNVQLGAVSLLLTLICVAQAAIEYHNDTSASDADIEEIDSLNRQFRNYMTVKVNGKPSSKRTRVKRNAGDELLDIKQNTNDGVFKKIDKQIQQEYNAMYFYEALSAHFIHPTVGKRGFSKLFRSMANEELEHARKLVQYVSDRGMSLKSSFSMIKPHKFSTNASPTTNVIDAVKEALRKEMEINTALLNLHKAADAATPSDPHLQDFLETHYLDEQVKSIRDLRIMYSRLVNSNNPKDIAFLMDQELLKS